jgi:hypothetical protein
MSVVVFLTKSTAWQRVATMDVGGDFPHNIHRLAAGGYDGMSVVVFLATSTAWQRVATMDVGGSFPGNIHRLAAGGYLQLKPKFHAPHGQQHRSNDSRVPHDGT